MDIYYASKYLYTPLRERTDLFEFNIMLTLRSFGDPCVFMCPIHEASRAGDSEALAMVGHSLVSTGLGSYTPGWIQVVI